MLMFAVNNEDPSNQTRFCLSRASKLFCRLPSLAFIDCGGCLGIVVQPFLRKRSPDNVAAQVFHGRFLPEQYARAAVHAKARILGVEGDAGQPPLDQACCPAPASHLCYIFSAQTAYLCLGRLDFLTAIEATDTGPGPDGAGFNSMLQLRNLPTSRLARSDTFNVQLPIIGWPIMMPRMPGVAES
jgi:hypothetical protein